MRRRKKPLILSVVGARPQFIKIAPLARKLSARFRHEIIHSGQHYDRMMSDVFFRQLSIPRVRHNLLVGSGRHGEMTGKIMMRLEELLVDYRPDMVLVYGDTNSTLAGALAAVKMNISVGHVEAGLRAYRPDMPEEINRVLTDHASSLLFAPTIQAIQNLKREGIGSGVVHSGDLMYELIDHYRAAILENEPVLSRFGLRKNDFFLMTIHRAGNVDDRDRLTRVTDIICRLASPIIFPIHPRTRKNLGEYGLLKKLERSSEVVLTEPLSYLDNLALIAGARAVLTDSGGIQKEAVFLGTPCLTLRDETEWTETLGRGNYLAGLSFARIKKILGRLSRSSRHSPYKIKGCKPSDIITRSIADYFKGR